MCAMKYPTWEEFMGDWEEFIKGSFGDRPMFPTLAPETPTFMGLPEAKTPEDLKGVDAAIIGAPYVATTHDTYAGVDRNEWLSAPKTGQAAVGAIPVGVHPGVPDGRVRSLEGRRLRRRPHPRRGYERPVPRKHSKGPGRRRNEGGAGVWMQAQFRWLSGRTLRAAPTQSPSR